MREKRKKRIHQRLKAYINAQAQKMPEYRKKLNKVVTDLDLFDKVNEFTCDLMERKAPELAAKMDADPDPTPMPDPHPFITMLLNFFNAHWADILSFILTLFVHAANAESDELAPNIPMNGPSKNNATDGPHSPLIENDDRLSHDDGGM